MNKIRKKTWRKLIELVKSIAINMNSRSCKNENENEQTKIHKIAKLQKCHNFIMSCFVQMLATLHYTNSTSISLPFFHHLYFTTLVSRFSFLFFSHSRFFSCPGSRRTDFPIRWQSPARAPAPALIAASHLPSAADRRRLHIVFTMKVTFRLSTEVSYSVTIPDNLTVEDLHNSAKVACPSDFKLPNDFKVIYNGEKLAPYSRLLSEFSMGDGSVVILMSSGEANNHGGASSGQKMAEPASGAPRKKSRKNRCSFASCGSAPLRMVGDCSHCQGKFCAKHRLLENHLCQGLQTCKDNAHEQNAMKLHSESTLASRV